METVALYISIIVSSMKHLLKP